MILIDSLYVNNGGGKVLLDYLIGVLELNNVKCFYLFDIRCQGDFSSIPSERKVFLKANLLSRRKFYLQNKYKFSKIFCFGNLPPLIKLNSNVLTYMHQVMYINIAKDLGFLEKVKFKLRHTILYLIRKNTNLWLVQNCITQVGFQNKYKIANDKVKVLAFYKNEDLTSSSSTREKSTYIYVSNATAYKNHIRLLDAFCEFYDEYKLGKLIVTVSSKYKSVLEKIAELQSKGYPVENIGFVGRKELIENYHKSEYLIFPSLEESFGLGIVEAIECGCKVIGADLPYMHQVCDPSITFNPLDIEDIKLAFIKAVNKEEKNTTQKIFNEIDQLISILKE